MSKHYEGIMTGLNEAIEIERNSNNQESREEITNRATSYLMEHSGDNEAGNTREYQIISDLLTILKN